YIGRGHVKPGTERESDAYTGYPVISIQTVDELWQTRLSLVHAKYARLTVREGAGIICRR
ncbi:MAG: hypothetical protein QGG65_09175, partial [Gammaproteobacteria bacterium]|nr:hypothetical protein [Gammaproteobacteria bacterium]